MWPVLMQIGRFEVTVFGIVMAVMFWVVSFLVWRRARHDFEDEKIFTLIVAVSIVSLLVGFGVGFVVTRSWGGSLYGAIAGSILVTWIWCRVNKWNIWEWIDILGAMVLFVVCIGSLAYGPLGLMRFGVMLIVNTLVWWLSKNYRKISWYKTGKMGFAGLSAGAGFCLGELVVAFGDLHTVYFAGLTVKQ